jgi:DNA excision repair protein ERCC-4
MTSATGSGLLKLPAEPRPDQFVALIDIAEQLPFGLRPLRTERAHLTTGDYSVKHLEKHICLERKSLSDLVGCCGNERARFERELDRMLGIPARAVIVEAGWPELEAGEWRSKIKPESVVASVLGWQAAGIPFLLAGTRERADRYAARFLFIAARRRWRELRGLANALHDTSEPAQATPGAIG